MKSTPERGFTLIELMVVIAIIGVLVAMLVPAYSTVGRTAMLVQCSNNLHSIYQAYCTRTANETVDIHVNPLNVYRWRGWLSPYFEDKSSILACPEADAIPEDDVPAESMLDPSSWSSGGGGGGGGGGSSSSGNEPTADDILKVEVWTHGGWTSHSGQVFAPDTLVITMDCEDGLYARKYNAGSPNPEGTVVPEGYEFWFEDGWNATWNDLGLRFVKLSDGSLKITMVGEHTGTNWYNLIDVSNNNAVVMGDIGWKNRAKGREVILPPSDKELPPEGGMSLGGAGTGSGDSSATASCAGNYGMNYIAHRKSGASLPNHIILCLDYKKSVAFGPNTPLPLVFDNWQAQGWAAAEGKPVFARHDHRINVLFTDGAVELMDPADIDPRNGSLAAPFWGPLP